MLKYLLIVEVEGEVELLPYHSQFTSRSTKDEIVLSQVVVFPS